MKLFCCKAVATLLLLATWSFHFASTARAQATAFTYQGRLSVNGAPANGSYDFAFSLFATNAGGVIVAGPVTNTSIAVSNGFFNTTLDFGPGVFNGNDFWLDISARPAGGDVFTELTPRQPLTPAPYALYAPNAGNATSLSGPIALSQLPSGLVTNNATNVNLTGNFTGNGSGITNVPGTLPWLAVSGTQQTALANQAYLLTNNVLSSLTLPATPNVGDVVTVSGTGSNGWQVLPGAGQTVVGYQLPAGTVWTQLGINTNQHWSSIACSADGSKVVAAAEYDQNYNFGYIYTSTNSGAT